MYIGRTPSTDGDLTHRSTNWPLTVLGRILWLSTSLESLTLLDLDQNVWYRFEHAVPASLRYLALGPIHGPFRPQDLRRRPQITTFVSVLTYMRDDEVRDVVRYPSMRTFRRLFDDRLSRGVGPSYAMDQAKCIESPEAQALESLEMVVRVSQPFVRQAQEATDDPRVVLRGVSRSWLDFLYDEYLEERERFINSQLLF